MNENKNKPIVAAELRRNSLSLTDLVFQGVTHIAPATNMLFAFPVIALKAGPDMPLALFLAMIICFFIGNTVLELSYLRNHGAGRMQRIPRLLSVGYARESIWNSYSVVADCAGFIRAHLDTDVLWSETLRAGNRRLRWY